MKTMFIEWIAPIMATILFVLAIIIILILIINLWRS